MLGFGFSREWPVSNRGERDVDAGAVIPLLDASAGGSGMAFLGARSFGDRDFPSGLLASLRFAAFSRRSGGDLSFAARSLVGDVVLLYACVMGPAWDEVRRRTRR